MQNYVILECEKCKRRNYSILKSKKIKEKLKLRKYCKFCKTHSLHKEVK